MKTNPYKVGDKVYWYGAGGDRYVEEVLKVEGESLYTDDSVHGEEIIHWKFYKGRLKPRAKPREFWIAEPALLIGPQRHGHIAISTSPKEGYLHVREVKPKP